MGNLMVLNMPFVMKVFRDIIQDEIDAQNEKWSYDDEVENRYGPPVRPGPDDRTWAEFISGPTVLDEEYEKSPPEDYWAV